MMRTICCILVICFSALAACTLMRAQDTPVITPIEGKTWVLLYYRKSTAIEGATATLRFEDGVVSGSTGCNSFSGEYSFDGGDSGNLEITNLVFTEMACLELAGLMEQEAFFLETLNGAQRFESGPGQLMIYRSGHETLTFKLGDD